MKKINISLICVWTPKDILQVNWKNRYQAINEI